MRPPLGSQEEDGHACGVSRYRGDERRERDHGPVRRQLRQGLHAPAGAGARGARLGPGAVRLRLRVPGPNAAAAYIAARTETLQLLLAHRPNVSYPTFAAKTFATLDQISDGRVTVHFITGGTDHEQQREGDYLTHDERYARTGECIGHRQAGLDRPRAVRPHRAALPVRRLRQRRLPGPATRGPGCRSAARPRPRTGPGAPRPTSTACGASRWPARRSRSSR